MKYFKNFKRPRDYLSGIYLNIYDAITDPNAQRASSSLSYYLLLSLVPTVALITIILSFFNIDIEELAYSLGKVLNNESLASSMIGFLINTDYLKMGIIGFISFLGISLWVISNGFFATIKLANQMFNFKQRNFFRHRIRAYVFSILFIAATSLGLVFFIQIFEFLGDLPSFIIVRFFIFFIVAFVLSIIIYKFSLIRKVAFKDLAIGSFIFSFLFSLFIIGFVFYLENLANYQNIYGSLATIAAILILYYLSSFMLYIGLCFNSEIYKYSHSKAANNNKEA